MSHYQDYDYELCGNTLVIYDLNKGSKPGSNTIDQILKCLKSKISSFASRKIIYRDSTGVFDGIQVNQSGDFLDFYNLGERVLDQALNKANRQNFAE